MNFIKDVNYGYTKTLYAMAWADQEIQLEELSLLNNVVNSFDFTKEQLAKIERWKSKPISIRDLEDTNADRYSEDQKKHMLFLAYGIAEADGFVDDSEKVFISDLKTLLGLNINLEDLIAEFKNDSDTFSGTV